jgi:hypothetical protein
MAKSYSAILKLRESRLQWLDEVPDTIRHGEGGVRVCVTVSESEEEDGNELESLLDELAAEDPFRDIDDPVEWQRGLRQGA